MTKDEFISRAAARYVARSDVDMLIAIDCAEAIWNDGAILADLDEHNTPESLADEDMTEWTDDE